jgi:hypothetical protein
MGGEDRPTRVVALDLHLVRIGRNVLGAGIEYDLAITLPRHPEGERVLVVPKLKLGLVHRPIAGEGALWSGKDRVIELVLMQRGVVDVDMETLGGLVFHRKGQGRDVGAVGVALVQDRQLGGDPTRRARADGVDLVTYTVYDVSSCRFTEVWPSKFTLALSHVAGEPGSLGFETQRNLVSTLSKAVERRRSCQYGRQARQQQCGPHRGAEGRPYRMRSRRWT